MWQLKLYKKNEDFHQQSDFLFLILIQDIVSAATSVGCHSKFYDENKQIILVILWLK